jgi:hypothetical protein
MDIVIARSEGIMSIDNQPLAIDMSPLAANIELIAYDCTAGSGNIEYSNSLRVLSPFIDVTPYAPFANTWLTAANAVVGMPVTLAQAKRVKIGLVDGIFNSKRQLPISYAGNTWDATDQAMVGMQATINAYDIAADIAAGDATLASNVNTMQLNVNLNVPASQPAATGGTTAYIRYASAVSPKTGSKGPWTPTFVNSPSWIFPSGVSGGGINQQPSYYGSKSSITYKQTAGPNVSWAPLNATTPVTMSTASMRTLISNIQARRASLQATRLTKTNAINLKTTIADIITYDVTAGWPF